MSAPPVLSDAKAHIPPPRASPMRRVGTILKRTLVSFYDDQITHHAGALTYYSLMSLFPAALLGLSLLGLLGQYPETYNAIINYLEDVVPASVVDPLDRSRERRSRARGPPHRP